MKNLLNKLDELEDGSYGRRLRKTEREKRNHWRKYYRNSYAKIRPINPCRLVGMHVNNVVKKYLNYLPDDWRSPGRLLNYLGIEIITRDGAFMDACGYGYTWRRHVYTVQYYVNKDGIITRNEQYKPYRYRSSKRADPHHIRIRKHMEAASKKRKEDREKARIKEEDRRKKFEYVLKYGKDSVKYMEMDQKIQNRKKLRHDAMWWLINEVNEI